MRDELAQNHYNIYEQKYTNHSHENICSVLENIEKIFMLQPFTKKELYNTLNNLYFMEIFYVICNSANKIFIEHN